MKKLLALLMLLPLCAFAQYGGGGGYGPSGGGGGGTNLFYYFFPATVTVSNTLSLPSNSNAVVTVTGTSNQVWQFSIPRGSNAYVMASNTITLAAGSSAYVSNTVVGNTNWLTFGIPTGATGATGSAGGTGAKGDTGATGAVGAAGTNCLASTYTTNITLGTVQAAWTVVLPNAATNYLVSARLSLLATSANPHGITLASGGKIDCSVVTGTLFGQQPFTILDQGDGKTFVISMDGDKANFLDNTGQPYSFSQAFVADSFQLQAKFTYLIQQ